MKILFVTDYYPSQEQPQFCIFIQQQAQALLQLGHQVDVIVPASIHHRKEKCREELCAGVSVKYCEYFTFFKGIYSTLALHRNVKMFEGIIDFTQYEAISIHMFGEYTLRIFTWIAKKYKKKLVIHYHGLSVLYDQKLPLHVRLLQRRGDRVLHRLIGKADAIVGVSNKVCERVKVHFPQMPLYTVYNGVNTELFCPTAYTKNKNITILSVASLKKIKGNHYLINVVGHLTKKYKDRVIQLIIIGHGPEEKRLKQQVEYLGLKQVVHFLGYIDYEEVAQIMKVTDIFAMPSYYEALGCAYLEAMACKVPVIGCYKQGIDEIIIDKENGLLVQPHNVRELYEAINFLIQNPEKAKNIAEQGYETVSNHYTWTDSARALVEVYSKLLG
ncbi:MAG: glycosyltransferase [Herbinix sp.]|jgi:glycosyltransferase involved in cell wall biosynthesis|nr:glycosyltransferase [Herbinix sp.]